MLVEVELLLIMVLQLMVFLREEPVEVVMEQAMVKELLALAEQTVSAAAAVAVQLIVVIPLEKVATAVMV